ncbi:MAG: Xaa-Pro aminopeptidase [Nevskiaceae bacterium]|nr:MAG: Xaa-Pro aminopeptidase [Nevskiaceae bacterium]TBR73944.1 MAG: Xaa-Pro aminopeptidase [Nevskiaceae bacterium]
MPVPTPADLAEYARRRRTLMKAIGKHGVAIIPAATEQTRNRDVEYRFRQDSDFWYLTGFREPEAVLVLAPGRKEGEFLLFVRPRDPERETWTGYRAGPEGAERDYAADQAWNLDELDTRLPALLSGREQVHCTLGEHPAFDTRLTTCVRRLRETSRRGNGAPVGFTVLDETLHEQRLIKRPAELKLLRRACDVSAQAHVRAMRYSRPGVYEYQLMAKIEHEFALAGMEPGYGTIVGGGANACVLHYVENDCVLRDGDLVLIDAGGELQGYTADITRTFPVNGRFSAAQREVYEVVLAAQLAAIDEMRVGRLQVRPHTAAVKVLVEGMVALGILHGEVAELIETEGYRRFYMHGTGHWLGLDVHDVGRYRIDGKPRPFEAGMVMTSEPGLYIPPGSEGVDARFHGIGIRIEDDVLVTAKGPEVLTGGVPKKVDDIEALMADAAATRPRK